MRKQGWVILGCWMVALHSKANDVPAVVSGNSVVTLFADKDLIKHPTGMTTTLDGKLLAVESHTHFRPKKYTGPTSDQIVWLRDTDNDGVADTRSVFYEGNLSATMDVETHPTTGAIYVATRTGVLRLWDRDRDGKADEEDGDRRIVSFELHGNFLDNGCAGLCFDDSGDLIFGIGSILGEAYTLTGSDGTVYNDQGEGGNIWRCSPDGERLYRFATGVWNPFGICHAPGGYIFATDNDPGSRPPCRLHHIVEDGDYGFQYRYGRSGKHPFISWKNELPGSLPMICETGEAPCDILFHQGNLIVASWSNHQIELYPLKWNKSHFTSQQKILIKGGLEFRPVSFTVGADGALYISDWVKQSYQVHGHGAIWRVENWEPQESTEMLPTEFKVDDADDPWAFFQMISGKVPEVEMDSEQKQIFDLLSARFFEKTGSDDLIASALAKGQPSEMLRMLALKWVADKQLEKFRSLVNTEVSDPHNTKLFHAALTALGRLDGRKVMDSDLQEMVATELKSKSPMARRSAFLLLEDRKKVKVDQLREIYQTGSVEMQKGVALTLRNHSEFEAAISFAKEIMESDAPLGIRALASLAIPDRGPIKPEDPLEIGEFIFHQHCTKCHRVDGFGKKGGPDLSGIGVQGKDHILQSIRDPSAEIAPQFEGWQVTMADKSVHVGFVTGEKEGIHYYSDVTGKDFEIDTSDMVDRETLDISLMPPGLEFTMEPDDFQCLVSWLSQLK